VAIDSIDQQFASWPEVPNEQRQKKLFHCGLIGEKAAFGLRIKGWDPIDVRLLPNETDEHRRLALKAWLEGIRLGTIELDPRLAKWLELESKVYEIHKGVAEKPLNEDTLQDAGSTSTNFVLDFGKDRPYTTTADEKLTASKRKRGRSHKEFEE